MPNLAEMSPSKRRRILVYGKVGTGKTIFACSMTGPIYVADFDGKLSSASNFYSDKPEVLRQITYDEYLVKRPFDRFNAWLREVSKCAEEEKLAYSTIVIDSLTMLIAAMLDDFMLNNGAIQRTRSTAGTIPSLMDYRIVAKQMREVFSRLFSLPCNIVVLAHLRTEKDELTGQIVNGPEGPASMITFLQVIFEEVYRSYVEGEGDRRKYMAQTQSTAQYSARSQIKGLPAAVALSYEALKTYGG